MAQIFAHYAPRETGQLDLHEDGTATVMNVPWSTEAFRCLDRVKVSPSSAGVCPQPGCLLPIVGEVVQPAQGRNTFWVEVRSRAQRDRVARQLMHTDPDLRAAWPSFWPTLGRISTRLTLEELQAALAHLRFPVDLHPPQA